MTKAEFAQSITGMDDLKHDRLVAYYLRLTEEERIAVHAIHTKKARKKSRSFEKAFAGAHYYATFLLAIREYQESQSRSTELRRMTPEEAAAADDHRAAKKAATKTRKASKALNIIMQRYNEIARMKRKGMSARDICTELYEKHGEKISHVSLNNHFRTIEHKRSMAAESKRLRRLNKKIPPSGHRA